MPKHITILLEEGNQNLKYVTVKNIFKFLLLACAVYFSYLMLLITLQYVPYSLDAAFLAIKEDEVKISYYPIAFYTHVYTSIFVLVIGFFQISSYIRNKFPTSHRILGIIYITIVLLLAAPSGLIMGIHGNGGIYSQISFCLQAILWFIFTFFGFLTIKKGNIAQHRKYMILSFALTLSAISLRLFKWIIVSLWALGPMDTYKIVVWLGWLFNIFIALVIIYKNKLNRISS